MTGVGNMKPVRIGVVLSSGGGRGVFAHTGFLMALEQLGIKVAAVAGCSAGALVGGVYASGTDLQSWMQRISTAHPREYWAPDSWPHSFLAHDRAQGAWLQRLFRYRSGHRLHWAQPDGPAFRRVQG